MKIDPNTVHCGTSETLIPQLSNGTINLVVTSPPYAQQRKTLYDGIEERDYPVWFANILRLLRPKLAKNGSVFVVIRSHVFKGSVSDYVLRTRSLIRQSGWLEPEEMMWLAPDKPPLGSNYRPRRTWEHVLWFSTSAKPYSDLRACSTATSWTSGRRRRKTGNGWKKSGMLVHGVQAVQVNRAPRVTDMIVSHVGSISPGIEHPAMFPLGVPERLIKTFSRTGDVVLDPFVGSGQTLLAAERLDRRWIGFDSKPDYVRLCKRRLRDKKGEA